MIERIFGILKRCFRILLCTSPEFDKITQTQLVPALAAIHNFRRLNNDIEEDDWDPNGSDPTDYPTSFLVPPPEPFQECSGSLGLTTADLSEGITKRETELADARRDEIATQMWASYQAYLAQM